MICINGESPLCTITMIICTCIWIPLNQITKSILRILSFLLNPHNQLEKPQCEETPAWELDLPVSRFQDLGFSSKNRGEEEMCSICLMEFQKKDFVNKLPRCGHIFHMKCIEKWLDRCQFTCPLCRSLVLHVASSPCKMWPSRFCILPPAQDS